MGRPRRHNIGGSVLGAVLGGMIAGPEGAAIGGILGTPANSSVPIPLGEAIALALNQRHLTLVNLNRQTKTRVELLYSTNSTNFWSIVAQIATVSTMTPDQLDDALYEELISCVDSWIASRA